MVACWIFPWATALMVGAAGGDPLVFRPQRVLPPVDPITNPACIPASAVKRQVTSAELVLGVVVAGQARAYPINMLTGPTREIINDRVGGRAIAATW